MVNFLLRVAIIVKGRVDTRRAESEICVKPAYVAYIGVLCQNAIDLRFERLKRFFNYGQLQVREIDKKYRTFIRF